MVTSRRSGHWWANRWTVVAEHLKGVIENDQWQSDTNPSLMHFRNGNYLTKASRPINAIDGLTWMNISTIPLKRMHRVDCTELVPKISQKMNACRLFKCKWIESQSNRLMRNDGCHYYCVTVNYEQCVRRENSRRRGWGGIGRDQTTIQVNLSERSASVWGDSEWQMADSVTHNTARQSGLRKAVR